MSTWTTRRPGRHLSTLTLTTGLALATAACSVAGTGQDATAAAASDTHARMQQGRTGTPLAELKGRHGLAPTGAQRNSAGYLTIRGTLTNDARR
ncbi:hypothetical protein [Streptomyces sp. NPDC048419]|uniref:hypothetical protein n=1 Tax=Streptomyces sp. NPDC048419 TaxID=3365547 RepID=UPI00371377B6